MMSPVVSQITKLFTADNGIHDKARHNDEYNRPGIFCSGHDGLCVRIFRVTKLQIIWGKRLGFLE